MMGRDDGQMKIITVDIGEFVPESHMLKKIDKIISFDFIYDKVKHLYSEVGRKSVDPVLLIKMLLIGYLFGIKSERRLEQEINLNLAYRWFCRLDLHKNVPDHSTFSQNRRRRFRESDIFREIFVEIVRQCIEKGLVDGENIVADGTFILANVAWSSREEMAVQVKKSSISYLDELDKELESMPGFIRPNPETAEKTVVKSKTDPDCGYINQPRKSGLGYTAEMSVDTKHGIITAVDVMPANKKESDIILRQLKEQKQRGIDIRNVTLDAGYDIGAIHRGMEILGITGYCCPINFHNNPMKNGFTYDAKNDTFICRQGKKLGFRRLVYKKTNANYFREYRLDHKECKKCPHYGECSSNYSIKINASSFYPSFYRNIGRSKTEEYEKKMRLRGIWSEGTFAVLKREHKLNKIQKRGIRNASEECLLAACALNLKRMVHALCRFLFPKDRWLSALRLAWYGCVI